MPKKMLRPLKPIAPWLLSALMLPTATGCYDYVAEAEETATTSTTTIVNAAPTERYVKLRIAIPNYVGGTPGTTRADESHGTLNEYQVHNGWILLFRGPSGATTQADQNALKFHQSYNITTQDEPPSYIINENYKLEDLFDADPSEHITSSGYIMLSIDGTGLDDDQLYALVLLNVPDDIQSQINTLTEDSTFCDLMGWTTEDFGSSETGYFMSNVAMSTEKHNELVTIPEVKAIFTENAATMDDGKTVFVERVAAKVSVEATVNVTGITIDNNKSASPAGRAKYHNLEWVVDNTNTKSYILRQFDDEWLSNDYMIDTEEVKANYGDKKDSYRTLWGRDVNYGDSESNGLSVFNNATDAFTTHEHYENHESVLIHENTLKSNKREDATRVVIRMLLKDASKVLLKKGYYGIKYKDDEQMQNICTSPYQLRKYIKSKASITDEEANALTFETDATTGVVTIKNGDTVWSGNENEGNGNDDFTIYQYNDCDDGDHPYVYYEAFILHFGDAAPTDGDNKALGKYGVVRNNAYTITIPELNALGSPVYPALGSGPIE